MQHKIRFLIAILISILPFNFLRVWLYRVVLNYSITKSKIGWLSIINVRKANINSAHIGKFNLFNGAFVLILEKNSNIGNFNSFHSGEWVLKRDEFEATLILKEHSSISHRHYFDVAGVITLDSYARVAGIESQFWTHGSFHKDVNIFIGKHCYIGSGVKFAPGASIADDSLVAMGSVVNKKFTQKNILIGGVPAKVLKENINWKENWV